MDVLKAPRLKKGDLIVLVSPAGTPEPVEKIERSVRYLENRGYRVEVGPHASDQCGYLAGSDEERAGDFNGMIRNPRVKAIFALRGGYGSPRLLDRIDYGTLRRSPKIVAGFSDITALQLAIYRRCGLVTFSGPMPAVEFWKDPDPYTEENFWRAVTSPAPRLANPPEARMEALQRGSAEGILLGGNLSLVVNLIGTRFLPFLRGAILVLEEVDEAPYRVDRMLTQMANAGILKNLGGLLFGQFTRCEAAPGKSSAPIATVLADFAARVGGPVLANLQYGHVPRKLTLPLGARVRIDASRRGIYLQERAVV